MKATTKEYISGPWKITERPDDVAGIFRMMMVRIGWNQNFIMLYLGRQPNFRV